MNEPGPRSLFLDALHDERKHIDGNVIRLEMTVSGEVIRLLMTPETARHLAALAKFAADEAHKQRSMFGEPVRTEIVFTDPLRPKSVSVHRTTAELPVVLEIETSHGSQFFQLGAGEAASIGADLSRAALPPSPGGRPH